nr:MAG: hypothetical protein H1BulkLitter61633_000002 [Mitovirus sp.]
MVQIGPLDRCQALTWFIQVAASSILLGRSENQLVTIQYTILCIVLYVLEVQWWLLELSSLRMELLVFSLHL